MSEWTDEEIARAAGLEWPVVQSETESGGIVVRTVIRPDWPRDPGACATWLLPVLERRFPHLYFCRAPHSPYGLWYAQGIFDSSKPEGSLRATHAPTWHECVIAAIMASARHNNKESENE